MRRLSVATLVVLLLAGCVLTTGWAIDWQVTSRVGRVYTSLGLEQVNEILDEMEIDYTIDVREGTPFWMFERLGKSMMLIGYTRTFDENSTGIVSLQLYNYVRFPNGPDFERTNDWNRQYRFSNAYIDADGDAVLESDLDLDGGIALKRVAEFIETFTVLAYIYELHITEEI